MKNLKARMMNWGTNHRAAVRSVLLVMAVAVSFAAPAPAAVRTEIPEEDPGPPFYARVERQAVHTEIVPHTDDWAAVVFYRSPACIPDDFNLMDLFDVPDAFSCALTVDGYEIWRNGPPPEDSVPMRAMFFGLGAVPVWFVRWDELQDAVADDILTTTELRDLPSLIMGFAASYQENLHPTDGAEYPWISISAEGWLHDGRTFRLRHNGSEAGIRTTIRVR